MTLHVQFHKDYECVAIRDICCFSGHHRTQKVRFKAGVTYRFIVETLECEVPVGIKSKRKPQQLTRFYLNNETKNSVHGDHIDNVPLNAFRSIGCCAWEPNEYLRRRFDKPEQESFTRIRGERANVVVCDEFDESCSPVFEHIVSGFGVVKGD